MTAITTLADLEALYRPAPAPASIVKQADRITPHYRALIEASPFAVLATSGPEGLDCSPRGDKPGFVRVEGERTLILPDRRGNNRIDSLRNIVRDPRVALLFLIPGSGTTFRVNGRAVISADSALLDSFAVEDKRPRTAIIITVEDAYFQCARAIVRSHLLDRPPHRSGGDPDAGTNPRRAVVRRSRRRRLRSPMAGARGGLNVVTGLRPASGRF